MKFAIMYNWKHIRVFHHGERYYRMAFRSWHSFRWPNVYAQIYSLIIYISNDSKHSKSMLCWLILATLCFTYRHVTQTVIRLNWCGTPLEFVAREKCSFRLDDAMKLAEEEYSVIAKEDLSCRCNSARQFISQCSSSMSITCTYAHIPH
jgi:hypothetical protein